MKEKFLFVRIDDVCPTMNWAKFNQVMNLLREYNVKPLLGVVPSNKDENLMCDAEANDFWQKIKAFQKEGCVIAQHGFDHVYVTQDGGILNINPRSEYAGLSYDEQYEKLKRGREILSEHNITANVFMAPSHSYDKNTLKALSDLGFLYITDGFGASVYKSKNIIFIPSEHWYEIHKLKGVATLCVHPNTMTDKDFEELKASLERYKESLSDYTTALSIKNVKRTRFSEIFQKFKNKVKRIIRK